MVARELNAKKLELLRELVPTGTVIGVLLNPSNPSIEILSQELLVAAAGLGQQILVLHARAERDFDVLFANLLQQHAHGLVVTDDPLFSNPESPLIALAARHKIPFYVAIPLSTIDWNLKRGFDIPIEERSESEVLGAWGNLKSSKRAYVRVANPSSGARNPGFDVTPPELITGIITPLGVFKPRDLWKQRKKLGYIGG